MVKKFFAQFKKENTCYPICRRTDGTCGGRLGGDKGTDYLSYDCIDCKYYEMRINTCVKI